MSHGPPKPLLEQLTAALAPRAEVLEAYLFGSVARGEARAHSDVDVAVYVTDGALAAPGFGYAAELGADLQQALGRPDIDLVLLNRATPLLYHRVLRDGVRLLSRDLSATTRREGYAFLVHARASEKVRDVATAIHCLKQSMAKADQS